MDKATDARRRLTDEMAKAMWTALTRRPWTGKNPVQHEYVTQAEVALDAILADLDDLAAVVDWPALLAAGERAGRMRQQKRHVCIDSGGLFPQRAKEIEVTEWRVVPTGDEHTEERGE